MSISPFAKISKILRDMSLRGSQLEKKVSEGIGDVSSQNTVSQFQPGVSGLEELWSVTFANGQ